MYLIQKNEKPAWCCPWSHRVVTDIGSAASLTIEDGQLKASGAYCFMGSEEMCKDFVWLMEWANKQRWAEILEQERLERKKKGKGLK